MSVTKLVCYGTIIRDIHLIIFFSNGSEEITRKEIWKGPRVGRQIRGDIHDGSFTRIFQKTRNSRNRKYDKVSPVVLAIQSSSKPSQAGKNEKGLQCCCQLYWNLNERQICSRSRSFEQLNWEKLQISRKPNRDDSGRRVHVSTGVVAKDECEFLRFLCRPSPTQTVDMYE